MRRIFRYQVPRGAATGLRLTGHPLAAAALPGCGGIEFWAENDDGHGAEYWFAVFGTGDFLPPGAVWRGTAARQEDGHVWHLYELAETP